MENKKNSNISYLIIVAALGYFVDIYDLLLFLIVKNKSLTSLGISAEDLTDTGLMLMNWQMAGLLLGGILWGILGDKKGR
ncbi:MAG: MFS transporter, partial [Pedobacter sp.]